jgi:xylulokinase
VIYSVTDKDAVDSHSRVNTFVHVSNNLTKKRNGVLLCVNGTGSLNRWLRSNVTGGETPYSYEKMNTLAQSTPIGSEGLSILPFGNGAERILQNKQIGSSLHGLDFNRHHQAHFFRASQEGIVFALTYGLEILQGMGLETKVIKAGHSNMFLSPLFREAFVNTTGVPLELYETDGATGAALGAGIGAGCYNTLEDAFQGLTIKQHQQPTSELSEKYLLSYEHWKNILNTYL